MLTREIEKNMEVLGMKEYPFSDEELKDAYRKKAFEFHPDINIEDTTKEMQLVNAAYSFLEGCASRERPCGNFTEKDSFKMSRRKDWRDNLKRFIEENVDEGIVAIAMITFISIAFTGILLLCAIFRHP